MAPVADIESGQVEAKPCPYGVDPLALDNINTNKDLGGLTELGGVDGLAKALMSSTSTGLDPTAGGDASVEAHASCYGKNELPAQPAKNFFMLMFENLQDPIIILLIGAAAVSTALGAGLPEERAHMAWVEGVAIWVAVFLVSGIGALNDYQKDKQFRKLNAQRESIEIKVLRGGHQALVNNHEIVVGDVLILDTGDKLVADCIVIDTQGLVIDEASLTGESDPIKKTRDEDPWVRSGTQVSEGSGRALVVAVGTMSEWGKTMSLMQDAGDDMTPLQMKLEDIAAAVGKVGFGVAVACFIALLIKWCVANKGFPIKKVNDNGPVQFFLYAVTIIVVAVPEGLPLAVTISLAYSMKQMLKDNNFVRVLSACETMGGATAICSDKTGTLTENRMTVVEGWFAGTKHPQAPGPSDLNTELVQELSMNFAMNSKAFLIEGEGGRVEFVGNRTECALLMLLRSWGMDYDELRTKHAGDLVKLYGFTSARKMAGALIRYPDKLRLYNKGAAEWVLAASTKMYTPQGIVEMTDEKRAEMIEGVTEMAKRGLRCICLTYTDFPVTDGSRPEDFFEDADNVNKNLIAMAIVGIKDPVRKEVPDAVKTCQHAGITVRMVTGDNIHTAKHIAKDCGILTDEDQVAMEGPVFRTMEQSALLEVLPRLRVLARSSPEDKLTLVRLLKKQGEVVAVTGDGTNDAPALKESDVGLAMGIAGTEVAKEAADIIILDDNFSSIVKSVLWGRSVFNNIQKFLQFQLTVNASALGISFIGALVGGHEPLTVLQLLWVNLIMDTMGALALATEPPSDTLLDQEPHGHEAPLITKKMWKHIAVQGLYQMFWMLICLYALPVALPAYEITTHEEYLVDMCPDDVAAEYSIPRSTAVPVARGSSDWYCQMMKDCEDKHNQPACPLYFDWLKYNTTMPDEMRDVICMNGVIYNGAFAPLGTDCDYSNRYFEAKDWTDKQYLVVYEDDWRKPLSILFNAFIFMQVANEINSRRINDEYNVFEGMFDSVIFPAVIFITIGFQAIIINLLGLFFKVNKLNGYEWLACLCVGMGSWVVSFLTKFVTKTCCRENEDAVLGMRRVHSGRTTSGHGSQRGAGSQRAPGAGSQRGAASTRGKAGGNSGHGNKVHPVNTPVDDFSHKV